jgi:hypothetical protein
LKGFTGDEVAEVAKDILQETLKLLTTKGMKANCGDDDHVYKIIAHAGN